MAQVVEQQTQPQLQLAEDKVISTFDQEKCDPQSKNQLNRGTRMRRYFQVDISTNNADVLMVVCCLISGLVDSTIYNG